MMNSLEEADTLPWRPACDEYFNAFAKGRFDKNSQLWFILPASMASIDQVNGALEIGSAGADSIVFCFRAGRVGVWAFHHMESRWQYLAENLQELERGWLGGTISV